MRQGGGIIPLLDDRVVETLERGTDVMWLEQQVVSHDIANVEASSYKAKKVEFKDVLKDMAQGLERLTKPMVEEDGGAQTRPDENNVQVEKEELELRRVYTQYSALIIRMSGKLSTLQHAINNTGK